MWCCFVHRKTHLQCFSFSARPPGWMEVAHLCSPGRVLLRCCKPGSSCNGMLVSCLKVHTIRPTVHPTFFLTRRKRSHVLCSVLVPDTTLSKFVCSFIYFLTIYFSRSFPTSSGRTHRYTNGRNLSVTTFFFLWCYGPTRSMTSSLTRFLDHTQRRTTVGRIPMDE